MKLSEILYDEFNDNGFPTLNKFTLTLCDLLKEGEIDCHIVNMNRIEHLIFEQAHFENEPLELKHLFPCGNDGKPLQKPTGYEDFLKDKALELWNPESLRQCEEYQTALKDVMFNCELEESEVSSVYWVSFKGVFFDTLDIRNEIRFLQNGENLKISDMAGQPITMNTFKFLD